MSEQQSGLESVEPGSQDEQQSESRQERRDSHVRERLREVEAERDQPRTLLDATCSEPSPETSHGSIATPCERCSTRSLDSGEAAFGLPPPGLAVGEARSVTWPPTSRWDSDSQPRQLQLSVDAGRYHQNWGLCPGRRGPYSAGTCRRVVRIDTSG